MGYHTAEIPKSLYQGFFQRRVVERDRQRFKSSVNAAVANNTSFEETVTIMNNKGQARMVHIKGKVIAAKDGTTSRFVGIVRD
ncbi:MAG: hypothetical protein JWQ96_3094 [Segetibacter sp.]|nr:hypothetical protein [Segetibacter sp.]